MRRPPLSPTRALRLLTPLALACAFAACDDDDGPEPDPAGDEEEITTVVVTMTSVDGTTELRVSDPDGPGGDDAVITGGTLADSTEYTVNAVFLNESEDPVEDVTEEIEEEDEEHQVFYIVGAGLNLTVEVTDQDENGNPIGLAATATTGAASSGDLTVVLRHEPEKDAEGVSDGDIANAGGETDIEVVFPVTIE